MGGVFWGHSPSSGPQIHSQRWPLVPPPLHTWGQRARSSLTSTSIGWDLKEKKDKEGQTHTSQELGFLEVVRESGSGTRRVPVSPFPLGTQTSLCHHPVLFLAQGLSPDRAQGGCVAHLGSLLSASGCSPWGAGTHPRSVPPSSFMLTCSFLPLSQVLKSTWT